jgi:acyl dehydratase
MSALDGLAGRTFGPVPVDTTRGRVSDLVAATGDDPQRWASSLPPSFANVVLFAVAPAFLSDPVVRPFTRSLIHSEQSFTWHGPLAASTPLEATGTLEAVRERSGLHLATFSCEASSEGEPWVTGSSVFLLSDAAATAADEEPEPLADLRPPVDPVEPMGLPTSGEPIPAVRVGASRADLVHYAAATRDWNPIHWDHDAARAAGLPGTIVHGLLMTAWMGRVASRFAPGSSPLRSMRARFRAPLRPGIGAEVAGSVGSVEADGADLDLTLASGEDRMVTARIRVTR